MKYHSLESCGHDYCRFLMSSVLSSSPALFSGNCDLLYDFFRITYFLSSLSQDKVIPNVASLLWTLAMALKLSLFPSANLCPAHVIHYIFFNVMHNLAYIIKILQFVGILYMLIPCKCKLCLSISLKMRHFHFILEFFSVEFNDLLAHLMIFVKYLWAFWNALCKI